MSIGPLCVLFGVSIQVFCPFLNCVVVVVFGVELYKCFILDINPLSDVSLVNMISHSVGCLFILLMGYYYFCCAEPFYSDVIPFVYFFFFPIL